METAKRLYTRTHRLTSVRIAGVGRVEPPPHLVDPLPLSKIRPRGSSFNPPNSFAEVGILIDLQFLLMQFLKYQQNVTTILIHIGN